MTFCSPALQEIVDLIGMERACALVEWRGGTYAYVPRRLTDDDAREIVGVIGRDAVELLSQHYGGSRLYVPRGGEARRLRAQRNEAIVAEYDAGMSAMQLALRYGLTERQVWRIISAAPPPVDTSQLKLFG